MNINPIINNETYDKLIDYYAEKCDAVMFVFDKEGFSEKELKQMEKVNNKLKKEFTLLKERNGGNWCSSKHGIKACYGGPLELDPNEPYYDEILKILKAQNAMKIIDNKVYQVDPPDYDKLFDIQFYRFDEKIKEYLKLNKNICNWLNPKWPEDIAFFKEGYCYFSTIAHEELCAIQITSNKEFEYLKSIGIEFYSNKFISTKKENLYYENY